MTDLSFSNDQKSPSTLDRAIASHKAGQIESAVELYLESIQLERHCQPWIYGNAIMLLAQLEQLESAVNLGELAQEICPDAVEILEAIGLALAKQGKSDRSLDYYLKSIALEPDRPNWLYSGAVATLVEQKRFKEAIEIGLKGLTIYPDSLWINYHLGDSFVALKQWSNALRAYQVAYQQDSELPALQSKINELLQRKNLHSREDTLLSYLAIVQQNPKSIETYYKLLYEDYRSVLVMLKLAFCLAETDKLNNAQQYYKKALALNPQLVKAYFAHSEVFNYRFDIDWLVAQLDPQASVKTKPKPEPQVNWLYQQYTEQIAVYLKLLGDYPNQVELYLELALVYMQQNRLTKAIAVCQRALRISPQNADVALVIQGIQQQKSKIYRNLQEIATADADYRAWWLKNTPSISEIDWLPEAIDTMGYKPLISILLVIDSDSLEETTLRQAIASVLLQIYPYWELCIPVLSTYTPQIRNIIDRYALKDTRIKPVPVTGAAELNTALASATGEFIALLQDGDCLTIDALYETAELLQQYPQADLVYSDKDRIDGDNRYLQPFFKPDWCPDLLLSQMYTSHLSVYRQSLLQQLNGFCSDYNTLDELQYDIALRTSEQTDRILHLPKVLYHQKSDRQNALGESAIERALTRRNEPGKAIAHLEVPGVYTVRYQISEYKLVSIVIPSKDRSELLATCLTSIFQHTTYPQFEVIVIDNGSTEPEFADLISQWQTAEPDKFSCHTLDTPFNYPKLNNFGVRQAKGDYLLFLNNDTEAIAPGWLEAMVEQTQRVSIGAVGAMLVYGDRTVQHGGVILGLRGVAGHAHKHFNYQDPGYGDRLISTNNYSAVTAACLMCRRSVYQQVNGFDEALPVNFNDVDFCLKLQQQGYHNVWLPHVVLYHHESKSRGIDDTPEKQQRFRQEVAIMEERWQELIDRDPCYNPNLSRTKEDYSLAL